MSYIKGEEIMQALQDLNKILQTRSALTFTVSNDLAGTYTLAIIGKGRRTSEVARGTKRDILACIKSIKQFLQLTDIEIL